MLLNKATTKGLGRIHPVTQMSIKTDNCRLKSQSFGCRSDEIKDEKHEKVEKSEGQLE